MFGDSAEWKYIWEGWLEAVSAVWRAQVGPQFRGAVGGASVQEAVGNQVGRAD